MKKYLVLLLVLTMIISIGLTGCGQKQADKASDKNSTPQSSADATTKESEPAPEKKVEGNIKFLTWETNIIDTKLKEMADMFMAQYPEVKMEVEGFSDTEAIKIRAASNELTDILCVADNHLSRDQWPKFFVPFDDMPIVERLNSLESLVAPDGKTYTLPRGLMISPVVWYNKSIFAELSLSIPKTYSEFLNVCQKIKDSGKYIPLSTGAKDAWPLDPFQQLAPIISSNTNIYNDFAAQDEPFTPDSGYVKGFTILKDLLDKDYFEKDPLSVGFDAATNELGSGKTAMFLMGTWLFQNMSEKGINMDDFSIFLFPAFETAPDSWNIIAYPDLPMAINKNTKSMDAAVAFINWYYDVYDKEFMKYSGMISPLKDADNSSISWAEPLNEYKLNIVTLEAQQEQAIKVWNNSGITLFKSLQEIVAGKTVNEVAKDLNSKFKKGRETAN